MFEVEYCPKCQTQIDPNTIQCSACMTMIQRCPSCRFPVDFLTDHVCRRCGSTIKEPPKIGVRLMFTPHAKFKGDKGQIHLVLENLNPLPVNATFSAKAITENIEPSDFKTETETISPRNTFERIFNFTVLEEGVCRLDNITVIYGYPEGEKNKIQLDPITVEFSGKPEIKVDFENVPEIVELGEKFFLNCVIKNVGSATAKQISINLENCPNCLISRKEFTIMELKQGEEIKGLIQVQPFVTGNYELYIKTKYFIEMESGLRIPFEKEMDKIKINVVYKGSFTDMQTTEYVQFIIQKLEKIKKDMRT